MRQEEPADKTIGKKITETDMITFLGQLSSYAHSKTTTRGNHLMIGQKNAYAIADRIHSFMDFAVLENCVGESDDDEFCSVFEKYYVADGKPVLDIEYPDSLVDRGAEAGCGRSVSDGDLARSCPASGSAGISRILKLDDDKYGLNGCTQYCGESASFVVPTQQSNEKNSCYYAAADSEGSKMRRSFLGW